mgnify:FL=1
MLTRKLLPAARRIRGSSAMIYGIHETVGFRLHNAQRCSATLSLGPVYSDRVIWVVVPTMGSSTGGNSTTSSVTIAGQAATLQRQLANAGGGVNNDPFGVSYWSLIDNGSLGTSALIEAYFGLSIQVHSGLATFSATKGLGEEVGFYADTTFKTLALPGSIPTSLDGWAFYCAITQNGSAGTNPDVDQVQSFDIGTNEWCTVGYASPTDGTDLPVGPQPNASTTQNNLLSALSMR